jgi:hypothetical protein
MVDVLTPDSPTFLIIKTLIEYQYFMFAGLFAVAYFGFIRWFTSPLVTRNPHELVVVISPNKAKIYKVVDRHKPMFLLKEGGYWYSEPVRCDNNLLHVYVDAVNQSIVDLKRNGNKLIDILTHRGLRKEVRGHTVFIPKLSSFGQNWMLVINPKTGKAVMERTKKTQPLKLNRFMRLGVYFLNEKTVEGAESGNANMALQTVTVQKIVGKIEGGIITNTNYSAAFSKDLIMTVRRMERGWVMNLLGSFDPKILVAIIGVVGAGIMAYLLMGNMGGGIESLGPPPPGVNIP